jgi:hypothetical protein
MTLPVTTTAVTTPPNLQSHLQSHPAAQISQPLTTANQGFTFSNVSVANWQDRSRQTSPDLHTAPTLKIAQSELPGGSTPPQPPAQVPPSPSIRDTGNGYPTRIPQNYVGPAIGFGSGGSTFGVTSRFPFAENLSIRPSALFGGNGTFLRVPVTYDFSLSEKEPFERNPLVTFFVGGGIQYSSGVNGAQSSQFGILGTLGVDVNLFEGTALVGSFNTDFASNNGTFIGLGFEF